MPYNFSTLVASKTTAGSIKNWINYDRIPADLVLYEAEAMIYERLRVREMRASTTVSLSLGASTAALPTGFLEVIDFRRADNMPIEGPLREGQLVGLRPFDDDGAMEEQGPNRFAIFDELFQFDGKAEAAETLRLVYYKTPAALSLSNETNFLVTRYPTILRIACLATAADYRKDMTGYQKFLTRLEQIEIPKALQENDLIYSGGSFPIEQDF